MLKELKIFNKIVPVIVVGCALIIGVIFNANYKVIIVCGDSMTPCLKSGNLVLIDKHNSNFDYGEIIVFEENEINIKRIIAIPGDSVKLFNNQIIVNGVQIKPYINYGDNATYQLKENEYFVLGDNYSNSYDSRDYGPIKANQIIGKVLFY